MCSNEFGITMTKTEFIAAIKAEAQESLPKIEDTVERLKEFLAALDLQVMISKISYEEFEYFLKKAEGSPKFQAIMVKYKEIFGEPNE